MQFDLQFIFIFRSIFDVSLHLVTECIELLGGLREVSEFKLQGVLQILLGTHFVDGVV